MTGTVSISAQTAALHALLLAPMDGSSKIDVAELKRLIATGADINAPDDEGYAPLIRHLSWPYPKSGSIGDQDGFHDTTRVLLRAGADLTHTTPEGITASELAARWNDKNWTVNRLDREALRRSDPILMAEVEEISTLWPSPGTPVDDAIKRSFMVACHNGSMNEIRYLLHLYPDAIHWNEDSWMSNGGNGLMSAINHGGHKLDVAELLVTRGVDVNWQNSAGQTALHLAASKGNGSEKFINLLVNAGANEKLKNIDGATALDLAQAQSSATYADALTTAIDARHAVYQAARSAARAGTDAIITSHRVRDGRKFKL